jgi:CHASE3 domain sensor protein
MLKRSVTTTILIACLTFALPAAYVLWSLQQQMFATIDAERGVASHVDAIAETLSSIATAQQGYVAPGQLDEPLFEETTALLARLAAQVNAFGPMLRSAQGAAHLEPLRQALEDLEAADARTRENLTRGQELMAADVIYSDGRNVIGALTGRLQEAQAAEQAAANVSLAQAARWVWVLFGVVMVASGSAFVALGKPAGKHGRDAGAPVTQAVTVPSSIDHAALAVLCTDVVRAADVPALERALEAAARLLDASSVMLWMSAGDRLFPALAHGFPADTLPRLRPIPRDADNAAAAAWQTGRVIRQTPAGDEAGAAIVAPLFSPEAAIGVLAVELRPGRDPDAGREAAVTVIAAQLSTVISAWPAASVPHPALAPEARTA